MAGDPTISAAQALEPLERLLRDLRTRPSGLSHSEVERRRLVYGPNEVVRRGGLAWPRRLGRQLVHPFALLLLAAAGLALLEGTLELAIAILAVVIVNAMVAFAQEQQAEQAVEALGRYLPRTARVVRAGQVIEVAAKELVPGDILVLEEGDRISADARLLEGSLEVDLSSLTGESVTVSRSAEFPDVNVPFLEARDLVFSGSTCTAGNARAVVFATGMHTELGRIAALSERVGHEESPLERQVRRLARDIALAGGGAACLFLLVGVLAAGLTLEDALVFAIGLLVANVPEGLLPTLTLALALAVRVLARSGALVKRLSAVETLGAATVICTDKTGTITQNRMMVTRLWRLGRTLDLPGVDAGARSNEGWAYLARVMARCNDASFDVAEPERSLGDPMEVALLAAAARLGQDVDEAERRRARRKHFRFDSFLKRMSTIDEGHGELWVHTKGAPEEVLARCTSILDEDGRFRPLKEAERGEVRAAIDDHAARGLRVLGLASRRLTNGELSVDRGAIESSLGFLGLVCLMDPPRPEVAEAMTCCHEAGIRVVLITGDYGPTAAAIARQVGLAPREPTVVLGSELEHLHDAELHALLEGSEALVIARASPETKLRVTDAFRAGGHVVAVTGDGVNDAPALRRADIGVAMGRSGTDVAREAATMILLDDDFATIVGAIREGRRVYDNVRKFIVYILAHLTPEIVPFLLFALSGGAIPLPITVLQILVIDLGTETIPALALGRERAEPGIMQRPPRTRTASMVEPRLLLRSWLLLGGVSACLVMAGFFFTLWRGGWTPRAPVGPGTELHGTYLAATTMTFLGIVVCQIGTAFAARTEHVALTRMGVFGNRLLLWGIAFEVALSLAVVYAPALQRIFATAPPPAESLLLLVPFPFLVWGVDEMNRWRIRRKGEPN